jgi:hypothetical protein
MRKKGNKGENNIHHYLLSHDPFLALFIVILLIQWKERSFLHTS